MKKKECSSVPQEKGSTGENEPSPEFLAFERLAKKVLAVSKKEIDRRSEEVQEKRYA